MATVDLSRFLEVHDDHERALDELRAGRKRTHWMWYVFPQAAGLGQSSMSRRYAITSIDEATAYRTHPVLGPGYVELVDEVWHQVVELGVRVHDLFGSRRPKACPRAPSPTTSWVGELGPKTSEPQAHGLGFRRVEGGT